MSNPLPSCEEMLRADARCIASGRAASELMEMAGTLAATSIITTLHEQNLPQSSTTILILCGPGNNGGDGVVIYRELIKMKWNAELVVIESNTYSSELAHQLHSLKTPPHFFPTPPASQPGLSTDRQLLQGLIQKSTVIIDALLGVGQKKPPYGFIAEVIHAVVHHQNHHGSFIFSVDVPSGVSGTTGEVFAPFIAADYTVSIQATKRGLLQYPGRNAAGKIQTVDIGIELSPHDCRFSQLDPFKLIFPPRNSAANKSDFGKVFIIGGSDHMTGAPLLTALGSLRSGAGYVFLAIGGFSPVRDIPLEVITTTLPSLNGSFTSASAAEIRETLSDMSAVVLGPGLSCSPQTASLVKVVLEVTESLKIPVVLDADGLRCLTLIENLHHLHTEHCILTPHPGEAAALLEASTTEIQRDRYAASLKLHQKFGGTIVLKGAGTIIVNSERGVVNLLGNPMLATAGSGDVLAGIIGSLVAQKMSAFDAAAMGVHLHARAADKLFASTGGPIIASDIAGVLSRCIGEVLSMTN